VTKDISVDNKSSDKVTGVTYEKMSNPQTG